MFKTHFKVARIQLQVLDCLQRQATTSVHAQEAISRLNSDLYDISQVDCTLLYKLCQSIHSDFRPEVVSRYVLQFQIFFFWIIFSQLYEQFAEPFGLPECQLAILHCAGHHDNSLIESLWQKIIDKGNHVDHSSACSWNFITAFDVNKVENVFWYFRIYRNFSQSSRSKSCMYRQ